MRESNPPPSPCRGAALPGCATGPLVAGAGIEPACKAYETSLIPDLPQCDGVTGRTRTGFLRGHVPACRPLQLRPQSTREESNLRHPPCEGGGLPLTYSSLSSWWGVVESNHVVPRYQRGAVTVWLTPPCRRGRLVSPPLRSDSLAGPRTRTSNRLRVGQVRSRLRHASLVVPGALESPPAGFRAAAPPSELQDHAPAREPGDRRRAPLRAFS